MFVCDGCHDVRCSMAFLEDFMRSRGACEVCGKHVADSIHCAGTGCGGHPICRPCYDLGIQRGLIRTASSDAGAA